MTSINTVTFVEEVDGRTVEREEVITSSKFSVKLDVIGGPDPDVLFSPAVVTNVEIENDGKQSAPSDQCGNTERRRVSNLGWQIRVQGIVTDGDRSGNLSMQQLRDVVAVSDEITIRSDVINGKFAVSNTVITQPNDIVSIETKDSDGKEKAFEFQLQLGESESGD